MDDPLRHEFRPGRLTREDAAALNAIRALLLDPSSLTTDYPLGVFADAGGKKFITCDIAAITAAAAVPWPYWGKIISQSGTAYGWIQMDPAGAGTFVPTSPGLSGTTTINPLYEENANEAVPINTVHKIWPGFFHSDTGSQEWLFEYCCGQEVPPTGCCNDQTPYQWAIGVFNPSTGLYSPASNFFDLTTQSITQGDSPCAWGGGGYALSITGAVITLTVFTTGTPGSELIYKGLYNGLCCQIHTLALVGTPSPFWPLAVAVVSDCACPQFIPYTACAITPVAVAVDLSGFTSFTAISAYGTVKPIVSSWSGGSAWHWVNAPASVFAAQVSVDVGWITVGGPAIKWQIVVTYFYDFVASTVTYQSSTLPGLTGQDCCSAVTLSYVSSTGSMNAGNTPGTLTMTPNCCGEVSGSSGPACAPSRAPLGATSVGTGVGSVSLAGVTVAAGAMLVVVLGTDNPSAPAPTFAGLQMTQLGGTITAPGGTVSVTLWYISVGSTLTGDVTETQGPLYSAAIIGVEVLGLPHNLPDESNGGTGSASAPDTAATATTSYACEYAQAAAVMETLGAGGAWANGFTTGQSVTFMVGADTWTLSEGYEILTSTGTPEGKFTGASPEPTNWAAIVGTLS